MLLVKTEQWSNQSVYIKFETCLFFNKIHIFCIIYFVYPFSLCPHKLTDQKYGNYLLMLFLEVFLTGHPSCHWGSIFRIPSVHHYAICSILSVVMRFVWTASIAQIDADSGEAIGNRSMTN